jgi:hypothetical protein
VIVVEICISHDEFPQRCQFTQVYPVSQALDAQSPDGASRGRQEVERGIAFYHTTIINLESFKLRATSIQIVQSIVALD